MRALGDKDRAEVLEVCDRDPVANVFVASRVETAGLDPHRLGAEVWPYRVGGRLHAVCYAGANLVPVNADADALGEFAERARRQGRRCSSIVGPAEMVLGLWQMLRPQWGTPREVRDCQPLLMTDDTPTVDPDPAVRRVHEHELETLLPASIAMFTEEIGISPVVGDGGTMYRNRVREIVLAGRSFARIDDGRVIFKAEVGAATSRACQVQGVWVDPHQRGNGLSVAGMAAVVAACRREIAPIVSLYVNDFNAPARRAYERVGFRQVGTFASILF